MQIFKRLIFKKKQTKPAQNLVEVAYIIPILVFFTLIMLEVGLFWKDLNAIYSLNAEINANIANLDYTGLTPSPLIPDPTAPTPSVCPAADPTIEKSAISIANKKGHRITASDLTFGAPEVTEGKAPFAMYKFKSPNLVSGIQDGVAFSKPQATLWVDCRNPFEDGVTTQIEFYHKTLIMQARMPRFDGGQGYEIIPRYFNIASPKLNTIRQY